MEIIIKSPRLQLQQSLRFSSPIFIFYLYPVNHQPHPFTPFLNLASLSLCPPFTRSAHKELKEVEAKKTKKKKKKKREPFLSSCRLPCQIGGIFCHDNSVKDCCHMDKRCGLQGIPWKDFSRDDFNLEKWDSPMRKISKKIYTGKQRDKSESVHKSWRVSKKRVMDQAFDDDEDDEDAEIRYLEKLKNSKFNAGYRGNDEGSVKKYRRFSLVSGKSGKEGKKLSRSDDTDCEEEHGPMPDGEIDSEEKKKLRKQPVDAVADPKWEMNLTTRQRALQSGKDASASGGSMVAFAKGLPPAPRKAKDKAIRC